MYGYVNYLRQTPRTNGQRELACSKFNSYLHIITLYNNTFNGTHIYYNTKLQNREIQEITCTYAVTFSTDKSSPTNVS